MRTNRDGTAWCLDTVLEVIDDRAKKERWPSFGDLIGADWMSGQSHNGDPARYVELAKARAEGIYTN